tara:strand:+ start:227075 stop:227578 length:504 start_codon:yes stop_codon:yes gene_type:complete
MKAIVGDITKLNDVDVIVNAANGIGVMGAGVAGAIARSMGEKAAAAVRDYCKENGPFEPGSCYATDAGLLKRRGIKKVYHAVTMKYPGQPSSLTVVERALKSVAMEAIIDGEQSIAIPGLGTGIGGLNPSQVANRMATVLLPYVGQLDITVVDRNEGFIEAVLNAIK